ncbi:AMP-binding protein [Streptomyces sp. P9(2023)]|uniref:AMP-binding protein n=1 Tax=Streptomyces sp. P9(2023) TaxID=3064394 RepID=UPI0028F40C97|nr:AMP-binding protein [Streptomyces sp. P9(2023)]MDT9692581.1 AMP-binding protein [Streptomyces sp. P9(2023)]
MNRAHVQSFIATEATGFSIIEGLLRAPAGAGLAVLDDDLSPRYIPYGELAELAQMAAKALRAHGVAPGDRVCLLSPTTKDLLITLFGIWRLGAVPVVLPRPRRADAEAFVEEVRRRVKAAAPMLLVTTEKSAALFAARIPVPAVSLRVLRESTNGTGQTPPMPDPDSIGLLQFTSGTTAASRAVPVTQAQLIGNIAAAGERAGFGRGDTFVSWLPLYHDMGIVSLSGIAAGGASVVMMATETFVQQPSCWLRTISDYKGTFTAAPNFAYGLAAKVQELRPAALNLSTLRIAINGAEAIDADGLARTQGVLGRYGFGEHAMCPMYGLAEATLAVSGSDHRTPVRVVEGGGERLGSGEVRPGRPLVSCGPTVPGTEIRLVGEAGETLPAGAVGEVLVKGPGVTPGYWSAGGHIDSADTHREGWLATGDLGFLDAGELVICGRIKDMVIAGGRNLYPEDYEMVAERVPGVRAGNVVAFSLPGQERMVVLAEGQGDSARVDALARGVMDALRETTEHAPHEVLLIKPGTLPKTSSGKRQRRAARVMYENGELDVLTSVR